MKILHFDLSMGAAGDMILASLLELMPDMDEAVALLNGMEVPDVSYDVSHETKCGIAATRAVIKWREHEEHGHEHHHDHGHHHAGIDNIFNIISNLKTSENVKKAVKNVYKLIAEAEGRAHGVTPEQVHFHELGAMDAVADIAGVCLLLELLAPERITATPVTLGFGTVETAHGQLPVPAPATAELLFGIPSQAGDIEGELCTPTGAALLQYIVDEISEQPLMAVEKTGIGCGKKNFPRANILRAFIGESGQTRAAQETRPEVAELSCNLDDMTGEDIAFALGQLLEAGALDVWTTAIGMKKNRPGVQLSCLCPAAEAERFAQLMLTHTTSLGVRETLHRRYTLPREQVTRRTPLGEVRFKLATLPDGTVREKPEFDDIERLV